MSWNRDKLEEYLADAYAAAGTVDFPVIVPESDVGAVLVQLHHLKTSGRVTSFSRRQAQIDEGRDDCVNIYGYVEL